MVKIYVYKHICPQFLVQLSTVKYIEVVVQQIYRSFPLEQLNFSILCFSYFKLSLIGFLTHVIQRVQINNMKNYKYKKKEI